MKRNLLQEQLHPFSLIPRLACLPPRRGGAPLHVGTLHRWRAKGLRGVRLEAVRLGGGWYTSVEALMRFFARISEPDSLDSAEVQQGTRTTAIEKALDDAGI